MLGTIMFCSKIVMEFLPNIHLLGMLTVTYTAVYRKKALIPIYIYVLLNGIYAGFNAWWVPYLYIWTILWAAVMLLPRNMKDKTEALICHVICALHGFLFGILYAPAQALLFGFSPSETLAWIAAGAPMDVLHGVGNIVVGFLIFPMIKLLRRLSREKQA